jgi:hypothetical protein
MDMIEVRRKRLREWIDQEFDGRVSAMCRYYQLPASAPSYISQLLSGHRVFGERAARKLETQCRRPAGWLDLNPDQTNDVDVIRFDRQRCAKLRVEDRELIEEFINLVLERNDRSSGRRLSRVSNGGVSSPEVRRALRRPIRATYAENDGQSTKKKRGSSG